MLDLILGASAVVTLVLVVLALASVTSWAVIALKFLELRAADRDTARFLRAYHEGSLESAYDAARERGNSPLAVVFTTGFRELARLEKPAGIQATRDEVESVIRRLDWVQTEEEHRLERGLAFLATTGNTAPFIGLFGTVVGIMNSFADIGATGSASLAIVAPGIAEALVATAVGLFAAIPAVVAYNYSNARLTHLGERLDAFRAEFSDVLRSMGTRLA